MAFNPASATPQLWVADSGRDGVSVFNLSASGTVGETRVLKDRAQYHYMADVSSISFDAIGQFATCQESLNTYGGTMLPNFFMGPTLYDARLPLINSRQEACGPSETCFLIHVDMLHESPLCMGIAHDGGAVTSVASHASYRNVYWAFGGGHRQLVRYDFMSDHGPGSMDHSIASVRRYTGLALTRVVGVPSHMQVDAVRRELFISDTGADRLVRVLVDTGSFARDAKVSGDGFEGYGVYSSPEAAFSYQVWDGLQYSTFATIPRPSGLALSPASVYASSHSNGHVYAWDRATGVLLQMVQAAQRDSLMGIALAPPPPPAASSSSASSSSSSSSEPRALYAIDASAAAIKRIVTGDAACPSLPPSTPPGAASGCHDGVRNGEETGVDCGGRFCSRCSVGQLCDVAADCSSFHCAAATCAGEVRTQHDATFLRSYLSSDFYTQSFAHHMNHGNMSGASYMNPYPIMEPSFCATVGRSAVGAPPNCSLIDFDSLLLGGCWCHPCLPENPCQRGGTCRNHQGKGYTCDCPEGTAGDHCQLGPLSVAGDLTDAFPFYVAPAAPPPPSSPPPPSPPAKPSLGSGGARYGFVSRVELLLSGGVSDFSSAVVASLAAQFAKELNVSSEAVTISVAAASVKVTVAVTYSSRNAAEAATAHLHTAVGSQAAATAFLRRVPGLEGVTVEAEPLISSVEAVLEAGNGQQTAAPLIAAAVAGGVALALLALAASAYYRHHLSSRRQQMKVGPNVVLGPTRGGALAKTSTGVART